MCKLIAITLLPIQNEGTFSDFPETFIEVSVQHIRVTREPPYVRQPGSNTIKEVLTGSLIDSTIKETDYLLQI